MLTPLGIRGNGCHEPRRKHPTAASWFRMPDREIKARFIEPMLLLPAENPPQDGHWTYELKLDGFRAEAIKTGTRPGWASRWRIDGGAGYSLNRTWEPIMETLGKSASGPCGWGLLIVR